VRGGYVFLGQFAAGAEEELVHLLDEEFLGLAGPGLQAVLVQQHLLALDPLVPGLLRDVFVDLLAEIGVEGRLRQTFHLSFVLGAENHVCHRANLPRSFQCNELWSIQAIAWRMTAFRPARWSSSILANEFQHLAFWPYQAVFPAAPTRFRLVSNRRVEILAGSL